MGGCHPRAPVRLAGRPLTRDILAGVPIAGVTGINGAGKTLWAVDAAIKAMKKGRPVYSTVPIDCAWGKSFPIVSLRQLVELHDCLVLLDEVSVIFSSRTSASLPNEVQVLLQTARHRKITIIWTAPAWQRCDVMLREVTQAVLSVSPLLRKGDGQTPWPTPRLTLAGLLDTSSGKTDATPTKVLRRALARPVKMDSFGAYDTHADTPLLGLHLQTGVCMDCGGSMVRPKHDKARHELLGLPWYETEPGAHRHPVEFRSDDSTAPLVLPTADGGPLEATLTGTVSS